MLDIPNSTDWTRVEKLDKGWMPDSKYRIETKSGARLQLEISPFSYYEKKSELFHLLERLSKLELNAPKPVSIGAYQHKSSVYMLLTWVEGEELRQILSACPAAIQYELGRKAGVVLKKIHSLPIDRKQLPKEPTSKRILARLQRYEISRLRFQGDEGATRYIRAHMEDLAKMPYVGLHGDFQPGSLVLDPAGEIGVLDLDHWRLGDLAEEFARLESCGLGPELSTHYCRGQVDGYFGGKVPAAFWKALGVHVASAGIYGILWGERYGREELERMTQRCAQVFERYRNFATFIPSWYTNR